MDLVYEGSKDATKVIFRLTVKIENSWLTGVAVGVTAVTIGAFYVAYKYECMKATRRALEKTDNSDVVDPKVTNITDGSILVELQCFTETSFLLFLENFEKKTVKFRLEEEFKKIGFEHKLDVTIQNADEVYEKARQIRERSTAPRKVEETAISEHSHLLHGKAAGGGESTLEAQVVTLPVRQPTTSFTKKEKEKEKESKEVEKQPKEKQGRESEEQPSSQNYLERISKLEKENVELRRKMEAIEQGFEGMKKAEKERRLEKENVELLIKMKVLEEAFEGMKKAEKERLEFTRMVTQERMTFEEISLELSQLKDELDYIREIAEEEPFYRHRRFGRMSSPTIRVQSCTIG